MHGKRIGPAPPTLEIALKCLAEWATTRERAPA